MEDETRRCSLRVVELPGGGRCFVGHLGTLEVKVLRLTRPEADGSTHELVIGPAKPKEEATHEALVHAELDENGHTWIRHDAFSDVQSCKDCGVVRRADGKNGPCKGKVKVRVRGKPSPMTFDGKSKFRPRTVRPPAEHKELRWNGRDIEEV